MKTQSRRNSTNSTGRTTPYFFDDKVIRDRIILFATGAMGLSATAGAVGVMQYLFQHFTSTSTDLRLLTGKMAAQQEMRDAEKAAQQEIRDAEKAAQQEIRDAEKAAQQEIRDAEKAASIAEKIALVTQLKAEQDARISFEKVFAANERAQAATAAMEKMGLQAELAGLKQAAALGPQPSIK